jgi:hypothetical protein
VPQLTRVVRALKNGEDVDVENVVRIVNVTYIRQGRHATDLERMAHSRQISEDRPQVIHSVTLPGAVVAGK